MGRPVRHGARQAGLRESEFVERAGEVGVRFWAPAAAAARGGETDLPPRQREVLSAVALLGEADADEIWQRLQDPPGARMVRRLLAALVESGRVMRLGRGRSTKYRLAGG